MLPYCGILLQKPKECHPLILTPQVYKFLVTFSPTPVHILRYEQQKLSPENTFHSIIIIVSEKTN